MKKVAFIGHSYHLKTKSSEFFLSLLQEAYELEMIFDESWNGKEEHDLSHLDESYHAVLFYQCISPTMLAQVTCKNVLFVPMYDQSGEEPISYWYPWRNLKVLNFSSTLEQKLRQWGFYTLHLRYYPQPMQFQPQEELSVFFWHRINQITWHTVKQLLGKQAVKSVHIHRAVDPYHQFTAPAPEEEQAYQITYSDWFETKEEYLQMLQSKSVYIAPRLKEGIGFSFLEAMAMGKIVIAPNFPTMNEYIRHGENGFLYDPQHPQPLELGNFVKMQEQAYNSVVEGRAAWERDKTKVIQFIDSEPVKNTYFQTHPCWRYQQLDWKKELKKALKNIAPYGVVKLWQWYRQR